MKVLNVVRAKTQVSDTVVDDPIGQSGQNNVKLIPEEKIPAKFFLYFIKLGDKHCTRFNYGGAFDKELGVLHGAPLEVLQRVKEGTAKIVLSWPLESFVEDSIFLLIHDYFKLHNISLSSVIYLNCCPNGKEIYDSFCDRHSIDSNRISVEYIPWYMYDRSNKTKSYSTGKKDKKFFALNRRMHEQRCLLLALMNKENLLDNFYMSFPTHQVGSNETFLEKTSGYLPLFSRYGITEDDVKNVNEKLPMILDVEDWNPYPLPITSNALSKFYENSFLSIVAETYFFSNVIHLTEKTFKPIVNHHPFIMVSAPNTLKVIKSFGYRTFDSIIDESYDTMTDHHERFTAILEIIRHVSKWTDKQVAAATEEIKEIVDYNYQVLHSRPRVELNNFVEKYGVKQ